MIKSSASLASLGAGRTLSLDRKVAEYHQTLLRRLPWPSTGSRQAVRTLGIASCHRGEGTSTVAAQLAITAAALGEHRVLLVDAHLDHPSVHKTFAVESAPGWAETLLGECQLSAALRPTTMEGLWVVTAGFSRGVAWQACDSNLIASMVASLKDDFDLVIFDLPPVALATTATRLMAVLDGVVLVVEAERIQWEVAQCSKQLLTRSGANLVGAVLNRRRQHGTVA